MRVKHGYHFCLIPALIILICGLLFILPKVQAQVMAVENAATSPSAAFGLRKLISKYSGPAVKIRRSSDNAETDIGFTQSGDLDAQSLSNFTSGSDAYVSIWYDQSGNAKNAMQPVLDQQPMIVSSGAVIRSNGKPAIAWTLNTQFLSCLSNTSVQTVIAVRDLKSTGYQTLFASPANGVYAVRTNSIFNVYASHPTLYYGDGGVNITNTRDWSYNGTETAKSWINGAQTLVTTTSLHMLTMSSQVIRQGSFSISSTLSSKGMSGGDVVSEMILYPTILTDQQRQLIETEQAAYYSISYDKPSLNNASDLVACSGSNFSLPLTAIPLGTTVSWSRAVVPGIRNDAVSNSQTSTISEVLTNTASIPIKINYIVQLSSPSGVKTSVNIVVTVAPAPQPTPAIQNVVISNEAKTVTIKGDSTIQGSGNWTQKAGTGSTIFSDINKASVNVTVSDYGTYNYLWTVTIGTCTVIKNEFSVRFSGGLNNAANFVKYDDSTTIYITPKQFNTKLNVSDSANMLEPYARKSALSSVAYSGDYNALINKPQIPTVPTSLSGFMNDLGYITTGALVDYITRSQLDNYQPILQKLNTGDTSNMLTGYARKSSLAPVAFSGDYDGLINKPQIPSVPGSLSGFVNDAGYITASTLNSYAPKSRLDDFLPLTGGNLSGALKGITATFSGDLTVKKLIVTQHEWSDYVFSKKYKLRSLSDVSNYIKMYQHLPDVPSAKEVAEKGISVGDNQAVLLRKIEELTLYMIEMKKENEEIKKKIRKMEEKNHNTARFKEFKK